MPLEERSLVFAAPDVGVEIFLRSGRIDRLLLADPRETSFIPQEQLPGLRRRLAELHPGTRMLLDTAGVNTLASLRAHPSADPLQLPASLVPLQEYALRSIDRRFVLRRVGGDGRYTVFELARLRA